jgi:hypothetical protein
MAQPARRFRIETTKLHHADGQRERQELEGGQYPDVFFMWSEARGCYVYQGKDLSEAEFIELMGNPVKLNQMATIAGGRTFNVGATYRIEVILPVPDPAKPRKELTARKALKAEAKLERVAE